MNRWLICFSVVLVGCVATIPSDPSLTADLACETARMIVQLRQEIAPAPAPSDGKCSNCNGAGKVRSGDGLAVFTCPTCKGTGKSQ